jgi:hypothetical protein
MSFKPSAEAHERHCTEVRYSYFTLQNALAHSTQTVWFVRSQLPVYTLIPHTATLSHSSHNILTTAVKPSLSLHYPGADNSTCIYEQ